MSSIQLLVDDEGNREALAELLADRYAVLADDDLREADLFLVDDRTLPAYRDALLAHKRDRHPAFCPVVLVRRPDTRVSISLPSPDETDAPLLVDDVVTAPLERAVLFRRLSHLLVRRRHIEELTAKTERLEAFAEVVSHDLRNPLQVAKGRLSLLRERHSEEDLDAVEGALDRMDALIEDILDLARRGTEGLDRTTVALEDVAREAWANVATRDASLVVEAGTPTLSADVGCLLEVFENLFRNSVEHGAADTGDLTVRVGARPGGFFVSDDGRGIPEDVRPQLFEPAFTTDPDGTGLGLSIVADIVDQHGWEIAVSGSADGGARFDVTGVDEQ